MEKKTKYQKPHVTVVDIKLRQSILAGSSMRVSGLSDEFYYDDTPGDGSDAYYGNETLWDGRTHELVIPILIHQICSTI